MFSVYSINDIQVSLIEEFLAGTVYHSHDNVTSCLLFEEPSTRTKESFRIAFNTLGIQCIDILRDLSSISKGETLKQTLETIAHYKQRTICVWRSPVKIPQTQIQNVAIINAGDGINEHPTQALGDLLTIQKALNVKFSPNFLRGMNIAIIGDIENSRVARSNIMLLTKFGAKITLVAAANLLSKNLANYYKNYFGCDISYNLTSDILQSNQFVMFLRSQNERTSTRDLGGHAISLTEERLCLLPKSSFIMHPGPVNIGVEMCEKAFYSHQSLIGQQVGNALLARKFLIHKILDR